MWLLQRIHSPCRRGSSAQLHLHPRVERSPRPGFVEPSARRVHHDRRVVVDPQQVRDPEARRQAEAPAAQLRPSPPHVHHGIGRRRSRPSASSSATGMALSWRRSTARRGPRAGRQPTPSRRCGAGRCRGRGSPRGPWCRSGDSGRSARPSRCTPLAPTPRAENDAAGADLHPRCRRWPALRKNWRPGELATSKGISASRMRAR